MFSNTSAARISFVGGGKMAQAILSGWLACTEGPCAPLDASSFFVANPGLEKRELISERFGVACVEKASLLPESDLVVLAVKPQVLPDVLEELAAVAWVDAALVLSIAAGVPCAKIEQALPLGVRVLRCMPNTPLSAACGASALCAGSHASEEDLSYAQSLFACIGKAFVMPEELIDVACAISGSGPAYVAALVEALAQAGTAAGLDPSLAEELAAQTVFGTGVLMAKEGQSASRTRLDVCSPGGTTLAALEAMEKLGYSESIAAGVRAALQRSKELGA